MINNHPSIVAYSGDKVLYYECLQKYDKNEEIEEVNPLYEFLQYEAEKPENEN